MKTYMAFKRILDILISIIAFLPLFFVAICVFVIEVFTGDVGQILYVQQRIGKNGEKFKMYKFRTMSVNADKELTKLLKNKAYKKEWDEYQKLENDPRITKLGKFLRKHSLDELPQFINTFIGNMSVIGPRPLIDGELELHGGNPDIYYSIKPGITGWWACKGRSNTSYDQRLELEYYYVNNCSFKIDLICVFKTIKMIITGEDTK